MVHPEKDLAERFQEMVKIFEKLIGNDKKGEGANERQAGVTFDNFCYLKVSEGAVREYSLAYGAKEKGGLFFYVPQLLISFCD